MSKCNNQTYKVTKAEYEALEAKDTLNTSSFTGGTTGMVRFIKADSKKDEYTLKIVDPGKKEATKFTAFFADAAVASILKKAGINACSKEQYPEMVSISYETNLTTIGKLQTYYTDNKIAINNAGVKLEFDLSRQIIKFSFDLSIALKDPAASFSEVGQLYSIIDENHLTPVTETLYKEINNNTKATHEQALPDSDRSLLSLLQHIGVKDIDGKIYVNTMPDSLTVKLNALIDYNLDVLKDNRIALEDKKDITLTDYALKLFNSTATDGLNNKENKSDIEKALQLIIKSADFENKNLLIAAIAGRLKNL